jgi:hypothetical protein
MSRWIAVTPSVRAASLSVAMILAGILTARAQSVERVFPQSKASIEKALKALQGNLSGRLPELDGFAKPAEHPFDRYQRAFYQVTVQVTPQASGGSLVHLGAKITAWYSDAAGAHSGYQALASNGRIEQDLLDQIADQMSSAGAAPPASATSESAPREDASRASSSGNTAVNQPASDKSAADTTQPASPTTSTSSGDSGTESGTKSVFSSSLNQRQTELPAPPTSGNLTPGKSDSTLQAEADNLAEVLKNQAHPKNLVAVKKTGTPVLSSPSLTAKPEFLASQHDEFELLDFTRDWVHVRISGLSRGWIWRTSVEMPDGVPDTDEQKEAGMSPAADLFRVIREETAQFPGDWEPLRGKSVKILSVQKVDENSKDAGPKQRLEYVKFLLDKNYAEISQKTDLSGIVVIFDSADGGMIAATITVLDQWRAGRLSDSALWHKCFFDPPETFDSAGQSGSQ